MKKSDIEHIQRSRFLESGKKFKSQIENIVQSINLKYPEIADNIEIPQNIFYQSKPFLSNSGLNPISKYVGSLLNKKLLA